MRSTLAPTCGRGSGRSTDDPTTCGAHRTPEAQMTRYLLVAAASIACTALPALLPGGGRAAGIAEAQAVARSPTAQAPSDSLKVVLLGTGAGPPVNLQQY